MVPATDDDAIDGPDAGVDPEGAGAIKGPVSSSCASNNSTNLDTNISLAIITQGSFTFQQTQVVILLNLLTALSSIAPKRGHIMKKPDLTWYQA